MTWGVFIVDGDGQALDCNNRCKHVAGCQVAKVAFTMGTVLTSVDVCCDGHTASGTGRLECNGFEDIADTASDSGASEDAVDGVDPGASEDAASVDDPGGGA